MVLSTIISLNSPIQEDVLISSRYAYKKDYDLGKLNYLRENPFLKPALRAPQSSCQVPLFFQHLNEELINLKGFLYRGV